MRDLEKTAGGCLARIRALLAEARAKALQSVNAAMVAAYWHIGREIVEEEQRGGRRAGYGERLIFHLSAQLSGEFGQGFSTRNLEFIRQFFQAFADRHPTIPYTACTESASAPEGAFLPELSWSHYRVLMREGRLEVRSFYEVECAKARWSVRELERQMGSFLYERLARSRDKAGVLALAQKGHDVATPADLIKDPYVLEFTGLPESSHYLETDLERALIDHLQQFLLELGRDLFFVARQKRITIDGDHFYIDLVFYHRVLRCFLLIDLKTGRLTQQDLGQMLLYTGYYATEQQHEGENPPIGLVLCATKNEAAVRYTLGQTSARIFASRYQLHLPTEQELVAELRRERRALEAAQAGTKPRDKKR
jgi:predicted nuclease of restriction endonuclease-like (RecB) superfamily